MFRHNNMLIAPELTRFARRYGGGYTVGTIAIAVFLDDDEPRASRSKKCLDHDRSWSESIVFIGGKTRYYDGHRYVIGYQLNDEQPGLKLKKADAMRWLEGAETEPAYQDALTLEVLRAHTLELTGADEWKRSAKQVARDLGITHHQLMLVREILGKGGAVVRMTPENGPYAGWKPVQGYFDAVVAKRTLDSMLASGVLVWNDEHYIVPTECSTTVKRFFADNPMPSILNTD